MELDNQKYIEDNSLLLSFTNDDDNNQINDNISPE